MILVLGGGWTGTRLCLRDPSRFITTTRSKEKLTKLTAMGIQTVQFDLLDKNTWSNLPDKTNVEATIFTFEILASQLSELQQLWETHIAADRPVLCLGTSSSFESSGYDAVVTETAPLTGLSITGAPLTDRVEGEEWVISRGATVLHLTGITGDEETDRSGFGAPRTIKSFLSKGYIQNGLRLLNYIHMNDIYKTMMIMIEKLKSECVSSKQAGVNSDPIKGQRILTSCGAFRVQDWVQALNMNLLPEIPAPDVSMKRSKIVSIAKLSSLLPADYEWTLPVAGVEPISRGLPDSKSQTTGSG